MKPDHLIQKISQVQMDKFLKKKNTGLKIETQRLSTSNRHEHITLVFTK